MLPHIKFANFNDLESVKRLITKDTCPICLETVQGEGGTNPAEKDFLKGIRQLCEEHEIQCGTDRSGEMFAYQTYGVTPDIVVSAKSWVAEFLSVPLAQRNEPLAYWAPVIMARHTALIPWRL